MSVWKTVRSVFSELNFMALVLYLSVATQGIASSYKQGAVNTIERRFYLNSRETGFIFGVYDGVFLVMLFVVSFYLDRARNRLVVVAVGVLVLATGLFTFSLPHYFVVGQNVSDIIRIEEKVALCSNESLVNNHTSTVDKEWLHSFLWKCFLPGNILIALGSTPLYTTGVALLGQNGGQQSLYEPIFYCIAMLAPAIGMVINSKFLQLFINYGTPMPTWLSITYEDPQWLGAWWIGFLINSLIALVLACILFAFAFCFRTVRLAPILKKSATVEKRLNELSPANSNRCSRFAYRALHRMKLDEALHAVITLLGNSYFTFMSLYATTEFAANGSIANNLIKFLEIQFARPSSKVSMEVGITGLFAAVFGLPVGCYLNKRIGKDRLAIIKLALVTACIHFALMFVFLWPCSDASKYAGIHLSYDAQFSPSRSSNLTATCNADCKCKHDQAHFAPVCAIKPTGETVTFLSACFAGCRSKRNSTYEDCSCLQGSTYQNAIVGYGNDGTCVKACNHVVFVYVMIFVAFFMSISTAIPNISSVLGCFPEQYKSVACSLQWLSLRLFGSITSSLIYAEFIKNACIFHVDASSDSACLLYDHASFGWALGGPSLFYKSLGIVLVIIAFVFEIRHAPNKRQPALTDPNNNRQTRLLNNPQYAHDHSLLKDDAEYSVSFSPAAAHDGDLKAPHVAVSNGGHSSPQTAPNL